MLGNLFRKKREKTFEVILKSAGMQKVFVVDVIQKITGMDINEATSFVATVPNVVKSGVSQESAEQIKSQLEAVGAKVIIK